MQGNQQHILGGVSSVINLSWTLTDYQLDKEKGGVYGQQYLDSGGTGEPHGGGMEEDGRVI